MTVSHTQPEGDGLSPVRSEAAEQPRIDRLKAETSRNEVIARNIVRQARYIYNECKCCGGTERKARLAMEETLVREIAKALTGEAKI